MWETLAGWGAAGLGVLGWGAVALLVLAGLVVSALGFTGAWLVAVAAALAALISENTFPSWGLVALFAGVAAAVDAVEWMAGHWGVRRRGGSRLAGFAAMAGGVAGTILGTMILPVIGSLLGMMAGGFGLAYLVEKNRLKAAAPAARIATGAVIACVLVLMLKLAVAGVLAIVLVAGILGA